MHEDGEVDVRGLYCAASVYRLLHLHSINLTTGLDEDVEKCGASSSSTSTFSIATQDVNGETGSIFAGSGDFIRQCQTYEGGIAGVPFAEAHGGYTFCGFAAAALIGEHEKVKFLLLKSLFYF